MSFLPHTFLKELENNLNSISKLQNVNRTHLTDLVYKLNIFFNYKHIGEKQVDLFISCIIKYIDSVGYYVETSKEDIEAVQKFCNVIKDVPKFPEIRYEYLQEVSKIILQKVTELIEPIWFAKELLNSFNLSLQYFDKDFLHRFMSINVFSLYKLIDVLNLCGDYNYQVKILETIFFMCSSNQINEYSKNCFPESVNLQKAFQKILSGDFNFNVRIFLNEINSKSTRVVSIKCQSVILGSVWIDAPKGNVENELWVDFNEGTNSISILCDADSVRHNEGNNNNKTYKVEMITVNAVDVETVLLSRWLDENYRNARGAIVCFNFARPWFASNGTFKQVTRTKQLKFTILNGKMFDLFENNVLPRMFKGKFKRLSSMDRLEKNEQQISLAETSKKSFHQKPGSPKALRENNFNSMTFESPPKECLMETSLTSPNSIQKPSQTYISELDKENWESCNMSDASTHLTDCVVDYIDLTEDLNVEDTIPNSLIMSPDDQFYSVPLENSAQVVIDLTYNDNSESPCQYSQIKSQYFTANEPDNNFFNPVVVENRPMNKLLNIIEEENQSLNKTTQDNEQISVGTSPKNTPKKKRTKKNLLVIENKFQKIIKSINNDEGKSLAEQSKELVQTKTRQGDSVDVGLFESKQIDLKKLPKKKSTKDTVNKLKVQDEGIRKEQQGEDQTKEMQNGNLITEHFVNKNIGINHKIDSLSINKSKVPNEEEKAKKDVEDVYVSIPEINQDQKEQSSDNLENFNNKKDTVNGFIETNSNPIKEILEKNLTDPRNAKKYFTNIKKVVRNLEENIPLSMIKTNILQGLINKIPIVKLTRRDYETGHHEVTTEKDPEDVNVSIPEINQDQKEQSSDNLENFNNKKETGRHEVHNESMILSLSCGEKMRNNFLNNTEEIINIQEEIIVDMESPNKLPDPLENMEQEVGLVSPQNILKEVETENLKVCAHKESDRVENRISDCISLSVYCEEEIGNEDQDILLENNEREDMENLTALLVPLENVEQVKENNLEEKKMNQVNKKKTGSSELNKKSHQVDDLEKIKSIEKKSKSDNSSAKYDVNTEVILSQSKKRKRENGNMEPPRKIQKKSCKLYNQNDLSYTKTFTDDDFNPETSAYFKHFEQKDLAVKENLTKKAKSNKRDKKSVDKVNEANNTFRWKLKEQAQSKAKKEKRNEKEQKARNHPISKSLVQKTKKEDEVEKQKLIKEQTKTNQENNDKRKEKDLDVFDKIPTNPKRNKIIQENQLTFNSTSFFNSTHKTRTDFDYSSTIDNFSKIMEIDKTMNTTSVSKKRHIKNTKGTTKKKIKNIPVMSEKDPVDQSLQKNIPDNNKIKSKPCNTQKGEPIPKQKQASTPLQELHEIKTCEPRFTDLTLQKESIEEITPPKINVISNVVVKPAIANKISLDEPATPNAISEALPFSQTLTVAITPNLSNDSPGKSSITEVPLNQINLSNRDIASWVSTGLPRDTTEVIKTISEIQMRNFADMTVIFLEMLRGPLSSEVTELYEVLMKLNTILNNYYNTN